MCYAKNALCLCLAFVFSLATCQAARAVSFTWIAGNGDWQVPQFWAPYNPPALVGPPGLGDSASIHGDRNVGLAGNVQGLTGLVLSANADLFTSEDQLTVVNPNGNATATIAGTGTTGQNTELFVHPYAGGPSVIADNLNLINGGELDLNNGAIVQVNNVLDMDDISIVTGHGTIVFNGGVGGPRLDMRGVIRPDGENTITLVAESGTINLDGGSEPGGLRLLDLSDDGAGLVVDGFLTDSYSGRVEMGPRSSLTMNEAWEFRSGTGPTATINIDAGSEVATIAGAEMTMGGTDAFLNVNSGVARTTADSVFLANSNIDVASGAHLRIGGDQTILRGGSWTGAGEVSLDADLNIVADSTTVDMPNGTFDLDGTVLGDTLVVDAPFSLNVSSVDNENNSIYDTTRINGGGQLNVQFASNPEKEYTFGGNLELNGPIFGTGVHLAGAGVKLAGTTTVSNSSTAQARVEFTGEMNIAAGGEFNLQGGTASNPNVVRSSAAFGGQGDLIIRSAAQLNAEDGAAIGVDVVNWGRFEPGLSIGSVDFDGSFQQPSSGVLGFEIAGPPGVAQDFVDVRLFAHLGGELDVTFDAIPAAGDLYTVLHAGGLLGAPGITSAFDSLAISTYDPIFEVDAVLVYTANDVFLSIADVTMFGDFNDDLMLDCADIDALVAEIALGGMGAEFDLNGDAAVNMEDLELWLAEAGTFNVGGPYLPGDATLDGVVDGLDFVVWNEHKFTNELGWCSGNFNADTVIDGLDFIIWNSNKFSSSFDTNAVPEPATGTWSLIGLSILGLAMMRR